MLNIFKLRAPIEASAHVQSFKHGIELLNMSARPCALFFMLEAVKRSTDSGAASCGDARKNNNDIFGIHTIYE